MRTSRLQSAFQPTRTPSLRRLRTVFSSSSTTYTTTTTSPTMSYTTSSTLSLSRTASPSSDILPPSSAHSGFSTHSAARLRSILQLRRKQSARDLELEEEKRSFGSELALFEPRPVGGEAGVGGIFEVLDGRV
ncbi:hypothetical protein W97_00641 [Coniosporium apollinis CBS 100218]|uniref:Uncharacterized protein n=1 Tax=Coniosporium apollinis (strain CBS 100218) TaxID=1168221 RepID=R7YIE8_CONA1|nr:uncharacterized protein W97_00641 [Coniosporium apollinis CBS 100218]EON61426.1 hypothetical protein W97_00641 [Coniosporium apollinis CBS 100218]